MKIIKILSLISFLTISIFAQTGATLEGKITLFGVAVKNTGVQLSQSANKKEVFTTRTDDDGNYRFENVPFGSYSLTTTTVTLDVLAVGPVNVELKKQGTKIVNLELAARDQNLGSVSISAGAEQTIEQVSKTVNVIDAQELRDRADFSLVESLRTIPGFRVQQLGGFGKTANIKTRGLRNQDTAVLIDGIRFRDASSITGDASAFLSDFTLTSVNKIEVLRGSGSSLYGTNAIGGTIDFQTPKPQTGWHGQIGGAFGGLGLGRFRGNTSYGTDKFGFNVGVSRTVYTKGIDGDDDARNTNFQSRIEYNPFEKTNISARFFVSDAFVRLNSNPDSLGIVPASNATIIDANPGVNFIFDRNDPDNSQKSKFFNGQIVLTQIISDQIVFQGYYSGLKTSRKNDNGTLGIGFQSASTSLFDGTIQTVNGHFNYTPNKFNEIIVGYEFEHEKYGNDGFTPSGAGNFFTRAKQLSNTFYAQDLISLLNGNLQIAGGFRAQIFSLKTPAFSATNAPYANLTLENPPTAYTFDGSASYFFERTGTKLRAHVGNGYRVPSLYERFGTFYSTFFSPPFVPLGAPDLKPEKTIAFDGGVEQNLFGNRAKLTAVYFYTKLIDTIGYGNLPQPDRFGRINALSGGGYLNTKGGNARGAEFSGKVKASSSTDIFASYTFTNSDQRVPQVTGNRNLTTLGIPAHQFTLVANQRFKRAWVNFDFLATSDYLAPIFSNTTFATYIYRFKGNRKGDLTGGYTFPFRNDKLNLRVYGTIENIFDYEYFENGFRTSGATARLGVSFGF
jgi:iron complex outermembrane receptor protein